MKIIVGLGNPTSKYENTRHNLGFLIIDYLRTELDCSSFNLVNGSLVSKNNALGGNVFLLCKPFEYMNNSGKTLKKTLQTLNFEFENVLLIYDELDIEFGKYKLIKRKEEKIKHLGVRDIELAFPFSECLKLKVGIRPQSVSSGLVIRDYVMEEFSSSERRSLLPLFESILHLVKRFI
ncbi:peptidyl-tRNA hydrolase [Microbacterium esteraromaticum]|nr:peptidyl-tRNA hydrolase [Microbacterium esteraromaticum]